MQLRHGTAGRRGPIEVTISGIGTLSNIAVPLPYLR
jgi:hypothetical protein